MESNIAKQVITIEEIKRRLENNPKTFPFTKEEVVYIRKIPQEDWQDIDLMIRVRNLIYVEFYA